MEKMLSSQLMEKMLKLMRNLFKALKVSCLFFHLVIKGTNLTKQTYCVTRERNRKKVDRFKY